MRRRQFLAMTLTLLSSLAMNVSALRAQSDEDVYKALLEKYVTTGPNGVNLVDYAKWKASKADLSNLEGYLSHLQSRKPSAMDHKEAFAFWVNLYNAQTLKVILDNYPVKSIRDIPSTGAGLFDFKAYSGPWRTKLMTIEGQKLSLDDIEHEILRPKFKDPRVHYAVNCASIGCPNLKRSPWTADTLDADLDAAAKAFINHRRAASIRKPDGALFVSSIYNWFKADFGGNDQGVITHLRKYAAPPLAKALAIQTSIAGHDYDWTLNDVKNTKLGG